MSDNNEPLDLQKIEARLTAVKTANYQFNITIVAADEDLANLQNLYINAPTDIAALLQRVKELEAELAEAKRTQVKDGGRGQLRPFPEPDGEE